MSTEYKVVENGPIKTQVVEHSGRFDLDVYIEGADFNLTLADGVTVEELAEVGLRILQAAIYNCADSGAWGPFRQYLQDRIKEIG